MDTVLRQIGPRTQRRTSSPFGTRNLLAMVRSPLAFLERLQADHGDVADFRMLGRRWVILNHPSDIEDAFVHRDLVRDRYSHVLERALGLGLLTSSGDLWKRQRKLSSTAFTPKRIKAYGATMAEVTARGLRRWTDGDVVNLHDEMSRLTMEVVAEVLFGAGIDDEAVAVVRDSTSVFNEFFERSPEGLLDIPMWVPTPRNRSFARALARIDALLFRIIDARRAAVARGEPSRDDLLGALLAAVDDEGAGMTDRQLRDETMTLFLAGHETTALALTHAIYLLARHPDIEERVREELTRVLGDRAPSAEDVPKLVLTDRVIKEAMRLYPPAWLSGREVARPMQIGGLELERGTQVLLCQWLVHHDPRWWREPEAFDPDRWDPSVAAGRPKFAYFPFGGGARICIGNHFAMMEAVIMLAIVLRRARLQLASGAELRFAPSVTLRPEGEGLRARIRRTAHAN